MTENRFSGLKPLYSQYLPSPLSSARWGSSSLSPLITIISLFYYIYYLFLLYYQVGFLISPVLPEHSGQYWCTAELGGRTSEYGVNLNVLMQTR